MSIATSRKILGPEFFARNSIKVARDLIGKFLVCKKDGRVERYMIIETEAYEGFDDKASKAHRGETPGNILMFGKPGVLYVYFTYGMHWMLNVTCGKEGHPAAVLIRGVDGITGPGRLTKALGIDKKMNSQPLGKKSGIWVEEISPKLQIKVNTTARIGIDSSGPIWSKKPYRFVIEK